jgi:biopolymer transport protein ExbB/TolQ
MAGISALQKTGIVILLLSFLGGMGGTVWSIYLSFSALEASESGGIGPVGDQISNALLYSACGFGGMIFGALLIYLGRSKPNAE